MIDKPTSFDAGQGFYRYLPVSRRDRDWGLFVPGGGVEIFDQSGFCPAVYPAEYAYDFDVGRRLVDEYALIYFTNSASWSVETEATGDSLTVPAGNVLLLFPGVWHRYLPIIDSVSARASTLWCLFSGESARRWQRRGIITPQRPILATGSSPAVEMGFRRLHNHLRRSDSYFLQQSLAAAFIELLAGVDAASRMAAEPKLAAGIIQQAKIILEDLTLPHSTPQQVAQMLNVPYNQLRRSFKLATGLSPFQYHLQAVMLRAKELLQGTQLSVKEIATTLQFPDQFYFAKAFKRKTGATPTDWRSRAQQRTPPGE